MELEMTTFAKRSTLIDPTIDFVSTDTAAFASHMDRCAGNRSRLFGLQAGLEVAHALIFNRLVTAAILAVIVLVLAGVV